MTEAPTPDDHVDRTRTLPTVQRLIDTHIHLYDPRRPEGVDWPPDEDTVLFQPHLPGTFAEQIAPAEVTGTIVVEASDRPDDNLWVLELIKHEPRLVAFVGNIDPYRRDFAEQLQQLGEHQKFIGLRARNTEPIDYSDALVLVNFQTLADAGYSLDILTNGRGPTGVRQITRLANAVPDLRIIVNHILGYDVDGKQPTAEWIAAVDQLVQSNNVFCKISGLYERSVAQPAPHDIETYRSVLELLWDRFGSDRLMFGSNWPVSNKSGNYGSVLRLVNAFFREKGHAACESYFWRNAVSVYQLDIPGLPNPAQ